MKKTTLFLSIALLSIVFVSCKKEDAPADARDKFVGRWFGNFNIAIPAVGLNQTDTSSHVITKDPVNANQIIIDSAQHAIVNGNSFTYQQYTQTETDPTTGISTTIVFNGSGSVNETGTNMNESGTLSITAAGTTFNGTWSSNTIKQ